jgi:hypothetical protein
MAMGMILTFIGPLSLVQLHLKQYYYSFYAPETAIYNYFKSHLMIRFYSWGKIREKIIICPYEAGTNLSTPDVLPAGHLFPLRLPSFSSKPDPGFG